ncbi:hypothetical protein ACOI1C_21705 [Bacillus sp. DJP31]|uniref:hypothetical protein n=1 Tax=Bacillus sp. DJP31 TaxID=3409789 RepID=UPI003BB721F5
MNNLLSLLFNRGKKQPFLNMFGRNNKGRGWLWGSLIGLGISAAALGLGRNRDKIPQFQNLKDNFGLEKVLRKPNTAGVTEFSEELLPNQNQDTNK